MFNFVNVSFLFITFFIFNTKLYACDASIAIQKSSSSIRADCLPLESSNRIFLKEEATSSNTFPLLQNFLDGNIDELVSFFLNKSLIDHSVLIDNMISKLQSHEKIPIIKRICRNLGDSFSVLGTSDPFLKEIYNMKAAMSYAMGSEGNKAISLCDITLNTQKSQDIFHTKAVVYLACGDHKKCLEACADVRENNPSAENLRAALELSLSAYYQLGNFDLGGKACQEYLCLSIKKYTLEELNFLYKNFNGLLPPFPQKPYVLDDLRELTTAHFTIKLSTTYGEAQVLFKDGKLEEAQSRLKECSLNPFSTLNILIDNYIVELLRDKKEPSFSIIRDLMEKITGTQDFSFNDLTRTLKEETPTLRREKFILELNKLYPYLQKIYSYEKEVNNKYDPFFKDFFHSILGIISEDSPIKQVEESPFSSKLLKNDNREEGILKDKDVNTISNKNLTKKKKRRKNRKQRHSSQTIMEKQTSSTSLVPSSESLDDTYKDGLNLQTAINERTEEDKAQEEPEISKNIETESNPNEELISTEKKQPLRALENDLFSVYQEEEVPEDDIMPYLMGETKQQLREFIARLYMSARKDHKELKTLKSFVENLILTNQALKEENAILKSYPKS